MPKCRDCGEEIVFEKRNGKWHPCDPERASHYRNRKHIKAVRKPKKASPAKKAELPQDMRDAVVGMVVLFHISVEEATAELASAPAGLDADGIVEWALKERGKDG